MRIAIDISPLSSGHKVRGVGFYLQHLKDALLTYYPNNEYTFFTSQGEIPKKVDVVHYPYFEPFFVTLPIKKRFSTVVTVHDLTPRVFPKEFPVGIKGAVRWRLQRLLLRQADAILTDSENSKKDITRLAGIPATKISVAYLAAGDEFERIPQKEAETVRNTYNLPGKFALYVGDVTWNKNVPNIVEASIKAKVPLVIVGKALGQETFDRKNPWNADLVKVKALVKDNQNIHILGFVPDDDVVGLYNCATLCVFPSRYEGFGLPVIEAMKCGCPVITSYAGSLEEVAGNGAYIVNPDDVDDIAHGISDIFNSPKLQEEFRKKGFEQAKKFSWRLTAEKTMEVYEKVGKII